ncbi:MAG: mechanosensitive ion channel family protein [Croceibacterium sp.]
MTLAGTVRDAAAPARAEAIAQRVQGVVTIENRIARDVSVDAGFGLTDLTAKAIQIVRYLPLVGVAIVAALVIALLGWLLASWTGLWRRLMPNSFLAELIASSIRFVFAILGIVAALDMLGAGTLLSAVLGGAGVIGIALGFAMRDTVENYVASLMLSLRQPFRANDHVVIDAHEGRVVRLTSRATVLMSLDGNHLRIPNSSVFKAVILNYTRNPQRRFDFELGIDANDDPTAARHLGVEALKGLDFVLAEPEPQARVEGVGDSNIVIRFLAWIDQGQADFYKARSRAIPAVKDALEADGFALPEPIYRLRFDGGTVPAPTAPGSEPPAARSKSRRPPAVPAGSDQLDTAPEKAVEKMVEKERAVTPGKDDLLDAARPVE